MAGIPSSSSSTAALAGGKNNYTGALALLTTLFFMWGFSTCMNDILIPYLKGHFTLTNFQVSLVQSAFFVGYVVGGLAYYLLSISSGDPIVRIGYKKAMLGGLLLSAVGCFLFFPASLAASYPFYLVALFVLALGFSVLQFTANPYVANLGRPETASSRLNLAQAFNSLGTTIAPWVGALLIFDYFQNPLNGYSEDEALRYPYLIFGGVFVLLFLLVSVSKLPKIQGDDEEMPRGLGVLKYSHLVFGAICIFAYVGGEVAIGSFLVPFLGEPHIAGLDEKSASSLVAFYWGGAMIGRFIGAISLTAFRNKAAQYAMMGLLSAAAFFVVFVFKGSEAASLAAIFIAVNYATFVLGIGKPGSTLGTMALAVVGLLVVGMLASGAAAMWSILSIGLFNAIMFPTIFTLAIKKLGKYTAQGSALLVMMIVGGAIITPIYGAVADVTSYQTAYVVPLVCYAYIAFYGFIGSRVKSVL